MKGEAEENSSVPNCTFQVAGWQAVVAAAVTWRQAWPVIGLAGSKKAEISELQCDSANNRRGGAEDRQTDRQTAEGETE